MGFLDKRDERQPGESQEGDSHAEKVQDAVQATGEGPEGQRMTINREGDGVPDQGVQIDTSAADIIDPDEVNRQPKQVEDTRVTYVPHKDFSARVNQTEYHFREDVPVKVDRELANFLLEDKERGYTKD